MNDAAKAPAANRPWGRLLRGALAAATIVVAAWLLAPGLHEVLQGASIAHADRQAADWLYAGTNTALADAARWVSFFHGTLGILVMTALAAGAFWRRGNAPAAWTMLCSVPSGMLLNVLVKHAVQRARPHWNVALETLQSFSFPSGHTAGATLFYGAVVALLWRETKAVRARALLVAGAAAMVLLVAAGRIVLGVHFLSDCIAAVVEALAWLAICLGGLHRPAASTRIARSAP